jgi:hypothetical protein
MRAKAMEGTWFDEPLEKLQTSVPRQSQDYWADQGPEHSLGDHLHRYQPCLGGKGLLEKLEEEKHYIFVSRQIVDEVMERG